MLASEAALRFALKEAARHVREVGLNNHGPRVEWYQRYDSLPGTGYAWCNSFVDACYDVGAGRPLTELLRSAGVSLTLSQALRHHWVRWSDPGRGDLVVFKFDHIGFVIRDEGNSIITVEGNTGGPEGDGVYIKRRDKSLVRAYIRVPGNARLAVIRKVRGYILRYSRWGALYTEQAT